VQAARISQAGGPGAKEGTLKKNSQFSFLNDGGQMEVLADAGGSAFLGPMKDENWGLRNENCF
jgi:hypothetical protein